MNGVSSSLLTLFESVRAPLARGRAEGESTAERLFRDARRLASELPDPHPGSEVAFSFDADRWAAAAGLLATWMRGHAAALAESGRRDDIVPLLARDENVAFLHDTGVGLGIHVPTRLASAAEPGPVEPVDAGDGPAVIAFRSCPLEPSRSQAWTAEELLADVDRWLARTGTTWHGLRVESTLTPTSVAGLAFALLVPLRVGGTFGARTLPPDVAAGAAPESSDGDGEWACVLAPSHARRMARAGRAPAGLRAVGVSDEGADPTTARILVQELGLELANLGPLPLEEPFERHHGSPHGEAAPELRALRDDLLTRPDAVDVAVAAIDRRSFVAVATCEGSELDRHEVERVAAERLPSGSDLVADVLPALPRDENGRLPAWRLAVALGHGRRGARLVRTLELERLADDEGGAARFRVHVPQDYVFFEGHYVGYPILPGAPQLTELVLPCLRAVTPDASGPMRFSGVKFAARIAPGQTVEVRVASETGGAWRFDVLRGGTTCTAGRVLLGAADGRG